MHMYTEGIPTPVALGMAVIFFIVGGFGAKLVEENFWKEECIKRGHAEYNQRTGEWQWKEPIKKQSTD